jgi:hypothetical protein
MCTYVHMCLWAYNKHGRVVSCHVLAYRFSSIEVNRAYEMLNAFVWSKENVFAFYNKPTPITTPNGILR